MSTNRHSRIIAVLVEIEYPLDIVRLTEIINKCFSKEYSPNLIGGDIKTFILEGLVTIDDNKCFSITGLGTICVNPYVEEAQLVIKKAMSQDSKQPEQI